MMLVPQDVIAHCDNHPLCKGCPLGTCSAPVASYPGEQWDEWLKSRIEDVRELK